MHSCLLKRPPVRINGGDGAVGASNGDIGNMESSKGENSNNIVMCHFGIYRTSQELVQSAVEAGHPIHRENQLPPVLQEAVATNMASSLHDLAKTRIGS